MSSKININFNFGSDTPPNQDPDSHSPTLRKYHKILWSKFLPNGELFTLEDSNPKTYLYHEFNLGIFYLGSDAITHSYSKAKRMAHIIKQVPPGIVESLYSFGSTIGSYTIFPSKKINNKMTINQARGINARILDRFDLTLECIRLFYENEDSPLSSVFLRYQDFFNLFCDFKGYVDFFLFQDLVSEDYSSVKYHLQYLGFDKSPLPQDVDEYLEYREKSIKFIKSRRQRMVD